MKKIFSLCMILVLLIMAGTSVTANTTAPDPDTVITKENVDEIVEYYGFDSSAITDRSKVEENPVTVREFEKTIEQIELFPEKITNTHYFSQPTYDFVEEESEFAISRTSATTVSENYWQEEDDIGWMVQYTGAGSFYYSTTPHWWCGDMNTAGVPCRPGRK